MNDKEMMNKFENEKEITISFFDLLDILRKCWWLMIIVATVCSLCVFVYSRFIVVPEYTSMATLYILKQGEETSTSSVSSSDFSLALNIVNDCTYLLKSHSVVNKVREELDLNDSISYTELSESISTNNPSSTRILEVSVTAATPELAKKLVDKVCEVGEQQITEAMGGVQQVNFFEEGTLPTSPSNIPAFSVYAIAAVIGAVAVYGIYFIIFILDDTIRTEEDVTKYLGLSVIGDIPAVEGKVYGRRKKKYGYGYGQQNGNYDTDNIQDEKNIKK